MRHAGATLLDMSMDWGWLRVGRVPCLRLPCAHGEPAAWDPHNRVLLHDFNARTVDVFTVDEHTNERQRGRLRIHHRLGTGDPFFPVVGIQWLPDGLRQTLLDRVGEHFRLLAGP